MRICVIGTGYVGLVTGTVFADLGNDVICVDNVEAKIKDLQQGKLPIYEPGLEEMVRHNARDGRLTFTTDTRDAVERSVVIFICVDTPPKDDGESDLSKVEQVAAEIGRSLNGYKVVVNKSTVPVGTGNLVRRVIERERTAAHDFDVVSNPEFLREGSAIHDALNPDRIVIGAPSKDVAMKLLELYATLERPVFLTDVKSAEIIKYASNAFLATKISFINAVADLCEEAGADINLVVKGMGSDARIGGQFLQAGLGYGGSCFPKDVDSLTHTMARHGVDNRLLTAVSDVNGRRVTRLVERMQDALGGLGGARIGVLGLAFKPNTDDMRQAKSIELIQALRAGGATIAAYDPAAMAKARAIFGDDIDYAASAYDVADGADALALVTEWREFKSLDLDRLRASMKRPVLFDARNLYSADPKVRAGFEYYAVGIGAAAEGC